MRTLGLEMRYACRSILKRPALSAIVVITLALGLGANAAIFSMIDSLVLRPFTMPRRRSHHAAVVQPARRSSIGARPSPRRTSSTEAAAAGVFEHLAAFEWWTANLVGKDEPENVQGFFVTADFFPALGVQPAAGRNFLPEDETQGRAPARRARSRPLAAPLRVRSVDRRPRHRDRWPAVRSRRHRAAGLRLPDGLAALGADDVRCREGRQPPLALHHGIGRLAPGRTLDDAKAQMAVVGERLARDHPDTNRGRELRVYTLAKGMRDIGLGPILSMWQASAALRPPHRVRQRREPAAGARRRAPPRDGRAPGDRREPRRASCVSC